LLHIPLRLLDRDLPWLVHCLFRQGQAQHPILEFRNCLGIIDFASQRQHAGVFAGGALGQQRFLAFGEGIRNRRLGFDRHALLVDGNPDFLAGHARQFSLDPVGRAGIDNVHARRQRSIVEQAADEAFATLRGAYEEAVAAIQAMPDGREAFSQAGELARILGEWSQQAAKLRAAVAVRIAKDEELSLAGLANRLSVSRARAQQFMASGRAGKGDGNDG